MPPAHKEKYTSMAADDQFSGLQCCSLKNLTSRGTVKLRLQITITVY